MELQQELVKKANNKEAEMRLPTKFLHSEKSSSRPQWTLCSVMSSYRELQDFIKDQPSGLTAFDEALIKRWLKQITIWDDRCTVELKSGLKVDVER
mgnify:CR=1 FL=1